MAKIVISDHARYEIRQRNINEDDVLAVAESPQQSYDIEKRRKLCQSRYFDRAEGKEMLLRLIIEIQRDALYLVTVYKTSKIQKYWRGGGRQ